MGKSKSNKKDNDDASTPPRLSTLQSDVSKIAKQLRTAEIKCSYIELYLNKFDDPKEIPFFEAEFRLVICDEIQRLSNIILEQIIDLDDTDPAVPQLLNQSEILTNKILHIKSTLKGLISTPGSVKMTNTSEQKPNITRPKLPVLPIPNFNGNPGEWIPFRNMFVALVHDNPDLNSVVKFSYLLDRIDKDTKTLLGTINLTSDGYERAWQSLLDCFDSKRLIVDHHIDALLNLPNISKESSKDLRKLLNVCVSNVSALEACDQKLNGLGEQIMINIVSKKINISLRKEWENELTMDKLPTWGEMLEFLKKKCRVLETIESKVASHPSKNAGPAKSSNKASSSNFLATNSNDGKNDKKPNNQGSKDKQPIPNCQICEKTNHLIFNCPEFLKMSTYSRYDKIKGIGHCFNCLRSHPSQPCTNGKCKICSLPHHTLLHHIQSRQEPNQNSSEASSSATMPETDQATQNNFYTEGISSPKTVLLSTAIVLIQNQTGKFVECRALLDNCSDSNYITSRFANVLNLPTSKNPISISGLNNSKTTCNLEISTHIASKSSKFKTQLRFGIVPEISNAMPRASINVSSWNIPKTITLADPQFNISRDIDILLGGEIFFDVIHPNKHRLGNNLPFLVESEFGWIVTGKIEQESYNFCLTSKTDELQDSLKRLFDIEPVLEKQHLSKDESICEDHFCRNHRRDETGRYVVSLPLRDNFTDLGESKSQALKRFMSLERKLDSNPDFKREYSSVIQEYLDLGHMKPVPPSQEIITIPHFYLPHHAVVKLSSSTTKVRVVFDASSKSSTQLSLNDVMYVGPTVQQSCIDITLRFRKYKFVFTSDINKMYRQVRIDSSQTPLHRILWRANNTEPIKTFELQTVTFGTASAPYLATRALKQLAIDESENFPSASIVTQRDFYVDDILSGADNVTDLLKLQSELTSMLAKGGFTLHKWCSNTPEVLTHIQNTENVKTNNLSSTECIKALGLSWMPQEDCFIYDIPDVKDHNNLTKRYITSEVAKLYDPLGFLTPVLTTAKIVIQQLWKSHLEWDDIVSDEIQSTWKEFQSNLACLRDIKIDRKIICDNPRSIELHGFADASEKAYGACIYVRSVDDSNVISVKLVCSKSRVTPIKVLSLPRLELCSSLLLSQLSKRVIDALQINFDQVYLWSDSQITLAWIKTEPHKLKTFVANRVSEIQDLTSNYVWNHVSTHENPADIISRGTMPQYLHDLPLWWDGPHFLHNVLEIYDSPSTQPFDNETLELKREYTTLLSTSQQNEFVPIERFSSYSKLLRTAAFCLRFIKNCQLKCKTDRRTGPLSPEELNDALINVVKSVQQREFHKEIAMLSKSQNLPRKSNILSLNPFLDSHGLLRVGGRLQNSNLDYDQRHQILIPSKGHFTNIIFRHYHVQNLHVGPQQLVSIVRHKFWPTAAKNTAKQYVRSCVTCFRYKPRTCQQIMGILPEDRVKPTKAFEKTGIDFCGPFLLKNKRQRNSSPYKAYVAIFICMATKGVHLEVLSDLTTECFLASLSRFIFRRGSPATIWSDNGRTFVGANNELKRLQQMLPNDNKEHRVTTFCTEKEITWRFIPPRAPNFGGLWESNVKSLKTHLKKVSSNTNLSFEEFNTLLIQVEGIMNSRPLTEISSDPSEIAPLTPSHFLIGKPIIAPPEKNYADTPSNRLSSWHNITKMSQHFWKRFSNDYLHSLQQRNKWKESSPNVRENDIVLLHDDSTPPTQWLLGKIITVVKGPDNNVRVVHIKTKNGVFVRSLSKICKLPID